MGARSLHGVAGWSILLAVWFVLGLGYSAVLTPSGRLLRRSSHQEDRRALFAAQFASSLACWLLTYPLAGWLGSESGMPVTFRAIGGPPAPGTDTDSQSCSLHDPEMFK